MWDTSMKSLPSHLINHPKKHVGNIFLGKIPWFSFYAIQKAIYVGTLYLWIYHQFLVDEDLRNWDQVKFICSADTFYTAWLEKIEVIIAKPTRVHGLLVFHPGEGSVETWVLWGDHLWEGRDPCMEWRSTKVYHGHPRLEGVVSHGPVSYTHKPSVCKSLQTPQSKKYKEQLAHVTQKERIPGSY